VPKIIEFCRRIARSVVASFIWPFFILSRWFGPPCSRLYK